MRLLTVTRTLVVLCGVLLHSHTGRTQQFESYALTNGSLTRSRDGTHIQVIIAETDLNEVKRLTSLFTVINNSYAAARNDTISDLLGNDLAEVPTLNALRARNFGPDTVRPQLAFAMLNISGPTGVVLLEFDETVRASTFDPTSIVLHSSSNGPAADSSFTLSGGVIVTGDSTQVIFALVEDDLNAIKRHSNLATTSNNTFLSFGTRACEDMNNNSVVPVIAHQVDIFFPDSTPPQLTACGLDMTLGILELNFSETVNVTSFQPQLVSLLSSPISTNGVLLSSTSSFLQSRDTTILISLSDSDLNAIKSNVDLAVSLTSTFCSLASSTPTTPTVRDMVGIPVTTILSADALAATFFVADTARPQLVAFRVDLNTNVIFLTFSEFVNVSSLRADHIVLSDGVGANTEQTQLSSGVLLQPNNTNVVGIAISAIDSNAIKAHFRLLRNTSTAFLELNRNIVLDMNGNPLLDGGSIQAEAVIADSTSPQLTSFSLNMNIGQLSLTFDETVGFADMAVQSITLQDSASSPASSVTLAAGERSASRGPTGVVTLTIADLNQIKAARTLAVNVASTFMTFSSLLVSDTFGNAVQPITDPGIQSTLLTLDSTSPTLLRWSINMSSLSLTLVFDETMDASTLLPSEFVLTSTQSLGVGSQFHQLSIDTVRDSSLVDGPTLRILLGNRDANAVKALEALATDASNSYLSFGPNALRDMAGNAIIAVPNSSAAAVSGFANDTQSPSIRSFDLSMDSGRLVLSFDETVRASSLTYPRLTLQDTLSGTGVSYTLTAGTFVVNDNLAEVTVSLSVQDVNVIQRLDTLCISATSCFLTVATGAVIDMVGNVLNTDTVSATGFEADVTPPQLVSWSLDMNTTELSLTYLETVDASSLVPRRYGFSVARDSGGSGSDSGSGASLGPLWTHTLQGGTTITNVDSTVQVVRLDSSDVDVLKLNNISSADVPSRLSLITAADGIRDMAGNAVVASEILLADVGGVRTNDATGPRLLSFAVDMNTTTLTLNFDEPVRVATLTAASIVTLVPALVSLASEQVTLTGAVVTGQNGRQVRIGLVLHDILAVQRVDTLFVNRTTSFITFTSGLVTDMASNPVVPISPTNPLVAVSYTADRIAPIATAFSLNMDTATLLLTFGEVMDASTLQISSLTLQQTFDAVLPSVSYTLTSAQFDPNLNDVVLRLSLSNRDMDGLKSRGIGRTPETSWLRMTAGGVFDMHGQACAPLITGATAIQVTSAAFIADGTAPSLLHYNVSLTQNTLTLSFSETVNAVSIDPTAFTFQSVSNSSNGGFQSVTLTSSSTLSTSTLNEPLPTAVVVLSLGTADLNRIKQARGLLVGSSSTFVALTSSAISDTAAIPNAVTPVLSVQALPVTAFEDDTVRPVLQAFSFQYHSTIATITLTFSETIDASTISPTALTFQDDVSSLDSGSGGAISSSTYRLQGGVASTVDDAIVSIVLSEIDVNELKSRQSLAVSTSSTVIAFTDAAPFVRDTAQNLVVASTTVVAFFSADTVPPVLRNFTLDLTSEELILYFSETVDVTSFNARQVLLQGDVCSADAGGTTYLLSGGQHSSSGPVVRVNLTLFDLNLIKLNGQIATSASNTFLRLVDQGGLVTDTAIVPNTLVPIGDCSALRALAFHADFTPPSVETWSLDMTAGIVQLGFSEVVNISTFAASSIVLQDPLTGRQHVVGSAAALMTPGVPYSRVDLTLSALDVNQIKSLDSIGKAENASVLSFSQSLVSDFGGNAVTPRTSFPLQPLGIFTPDSRAPSLVAYQLNLTSQTLDLTFSETVRLSSVVTSRITLQTARSLAPVPNITLSTSASVAIGPSSLLSTHIRLTLTQSDIDRFHVAGLSALSSSFLSTQPAAFEDMQGNPAGAITSENALEATLFVGDTVRPALASFGLDMNSGELQLTFSEAVNAQLTTPTAFTVQDSTRASRNGSGVILYALQLNGGTIVPLSSTVVSIQLIEADLNEFKRMTGVATGTANTFITFAQDSVFDVSGNGIAARLDGAGIRASFVRTDQTRPVLRSFGVEMSPDGPPLRLRLTFSETVDVSTLDLTKLIVQGAQDGTLSGTRSHRLTGGIATPVRAP
eukprot:m.75387 g.75387  ORF g.75387 m.75387 type:complete len:2088 (-) comp10412_c0_seq1:163-6426(-)